jgi:hypothetical protein
MVFALLTKPMRVIFAYQDGQPQASDGLNYAGSLDAIIRAFRRGKGCCSSGVEDVLIFSTAVSSSENPRAVMPASPEEVRTAPNLALSCALHWRLEGLLWYHTLLMPDTIVIRSR